MDTKPTSSDDDLVRKVYEVSVSPQRLSDFIAQWDRAMADPSGNLAFLAGHLDNATAVLEQLSQAEQRAEAGSASVPPSGPSANPTMQGIVSAAGTFLEWRGQDAGSLNTDRLGPRTLFALLPEMYHEEARAALARLQTDPQARAQILICNAHEGATDALMLIQKLDAAERGAAPRFFVRWLKSMWTPHLQSFFAQRHGLTPAELALYQRMVAGMSFREIESNLQKSRDTVKSQAKSIYSKLGVAGREDAVRLALQIQFLLPHPAGPEAHAVLRHATETVKVGDRHLGIVRKGAEAGDPFVFLHGALTGFSLGPAFEAALKTANLCMICIERPGYGRSSDPLSVDRILDEWVRGFPDLMAALGLTQTTVVSHASGAAYAAVTLGQCPDLAPRGLGISAGLPKFSDEIGARHPAFHRFVHWCLRQSPGALDFIINAYMAYRKRGQSVERIIQDNYRACTPDRLALAEPENLACLVEGYTLFERPKLMGLRGDIHGLWLHLDRWKDLLQIPHGTAQFHHLWGEEDPMITLEDGYAYCAHYPFLSCSVVPGAGHLVYLTHPEAVVARIRHMVDNDPAWRV